MSDPIGANLRDYDRLTEACERQRIENEALRKRVADMTRALEAARTLHKFADELCTAVDLADEDIGGARHTMEILRDLGPATDAFERALAALASAESKEGDGK